MYDTVADKNDAVIDAQKKNDASCECTIPLQEKNEVVTDAQNKNN